MDYTQAYNQTASVYQPQVDLINQQIGQLQPQQDAEQASLDQAKVNAFKDITNQSNSRGVLFSGVPIDQQATYVGEKYLPAVANLKSTFQNNKNTLLGQINDIQAKRATQAQNTVSDYQKNAADTAYKNAQLALSYARLGNSQGNTSTAAQQKLQSQFKVTGKKAIDSGATTATSSNSHGYEYTGPNGTPINMYQYLVGSGQGVDSLANLLQNGSAFDKAVYNKYSNIKDPTKFYNAVRNDSANRFYGLQAE